MSTIILPEQNKVIFPERRFKDLHYRFLKREHEIAIPLADTFWHLGDVGVSALTLLEPGLLVDMISAPITSGEIITGWTRLQVFHATIEYIDRQDPGRVFSPMPFELRLGHLAREWRQNNPEGYCYELMRDFYRRIFRTGRIRRLYLAYNWLTSIGCQFEHNVCKKIGVELVFLTKEDTEKALGEFSLAE